MDHDTTWYGGRPGLRRHCVRCRPSSPHWQGHSSPQTLRPIPFVDDAKCTLVTAVCVNIVQNAKCQRVLVLALCLVVFCVTMQSPAAASWASTSSGTRTVSATSVDLWRRESGLPGYQSGLSGAWQSDERALRASDLCTGSASVRVSGTSVWQRYSEIHESTRSQYDLSTESKLWNLWHSPHSARILHQV